MKNFFTRTCLMQGLIALPLVLVVFASNATNRAMLMEEQFNGTTLSSGWCIAGHESTKWEIPSSLKVGGSLNELLLSYNPSFNGVSHLVTPAINLTGKTSSGLDVEPNVIPETSTDNDMVARAISAASQQVQRTVMIEQFSSSTCPPCVTPNIQMQTLFNNNPGKFCVVKYQMNWPGNGDPYYTAEGGVRRTYYNINSVPAIRTEGGANTSVPLTQAQLDQLYATPAHLDIEGGFKVEGTKVKINLTITPYLTVASGVKLYVVVSEKTTTGNVGTNGETSFHHVMMKMVPNANGTDISLTDGVAQTFNFEQEMAGTHVEEYGDLEVAVFVQQHSSKYIYNSRFIHQGCPPPSGLVGTASEQNVTLKWNRAAVESSTYNVYRNGSIVAQNITDTVYYDNGLELGMHKYKVCASCGVNNFSKEVQVGVGCIPVTNLVVVGNATSPTNVFADISWQHSVSSYAVTGYKIFKGNDSIGAVTSSANSYTHSGLTLGEFCFKIQTVCGTLLSSVTAPVCVTFTCTAPSALTATADGTTVNLKWKKPSNLTTSYNVYRNGVVLAQNITDTTYANADLEPGAYKYKVNAACGTSVSNFSNEVTVKVGCIAPANFKLTPVGNNKIRLDWDVSPTANKYNVYNGDNLIAPAISGRTYTHSNLTAGSYCYRVKSICDGNVLSDPTNELCHTIVGINEMYSSTKIYPNPASTQVQIEGNSMKRVLVYDVVGRLVDSRQLDNAASCIIETGAYQAGIYMFCIEFADGGELVKRIAIAR